MAKTIDVLVVESRPGASNDAVVALEAAGHRVHRCHDEPHHPFPCKGLVEVGSCPIDGHVDVALVVRHRVNPRPTSLEGGLRCAIRAGVPIVEDGPEILDPYAPWIAMRVGRCDDLAARCAEASELALEPLYRNVATRIAALLAAAAIAPDDVRCRIEREAHRLHVHLALPVVVADRVKQALAVRVLDAVRETGHTFGAVDLHVHPPGEQAEVS